MIYIFWTCANREEAKKIAHLLLEKRMIACASILPQVESIYRWKGKIEEATETKVIFKTEERHFDSIRKLIEKEGSYEVPEIVQVEIVQGNPSYLSWVFQETETC